MIAIPYADSSDHSAAHLEMNFVVVGQTLTLPFNDDVVKFAEFAAIDARCIWVWVRLQNTLAKFKDILKSSRFCDEDPAIYVHNRFSFWSLIWSRLCF